MLSLDNAMDESEMRAFVERLGRMLGHRDAGIPLMAEPKLDGAGVELVYEDGRFIRGLTRGDGIAGEEISANLLQIPSIPGALDERGQPAPGVASIRGEVVLPTAAFKRLNALRVERELEPFANPRNAAAGGLRQIHDVDTLRLRSLEFRAYAIEDGRPETLETQEGLLATLAGWGFLVSPESTLCADLSSAIEFHDSLRPTS